MPTHQIHVSGAREQVQEIRRALFGFSEVLDVFATGRPDVLVVAYAGRPRPGEWLRALRGLGYRTPARAHARWLRPEQVPDAILRRVVDYADAGAHDDDQNSIRNQPEPGQRRDAA